MAVNGRRADRVAAILAGAVAFVVYLLTLAPDMLPGDSGEFQFAAPLLSIVHPTGYPLYLIIAKAFTLLPLGSSAYRVNLFSAVSAALAVGVLTAAIHESLACFELALWPRRVIAVSAALTFAFTSTLWLQATEAEVYALHALFVAIIFALTVRATEPGRAESTVLWLALAVGLSFAHHRTTLLVLPALAVMLWDTRLPPRRWAQAVLLLVLPALLYLYTPLRYDATPYTQIVLDASHTITTLDRTPAAFVGHVLGSGFRGALGWDMLSIKRLRDAPALIAAALGGASGWVVIALALIGALSPWLARRGHDVGRLVAALALTLAVSVVFNAAYHIGDISDYYTPVLLMVVWLAGLGLAVLVQCLPSQRMAVGLAGVAITLPAYLLAAGYGDHLGHESVRSEATALLSAAPPNAILISNDRDEMTPFFYLQYVDSMRRDIAPLFPLISTDLPDVVRLTRYALQSSRPVMFTKPMPGLDTVFTLRPEGIYERVVAPADVTYAHAGGAESPGVRLLGWSVLTATRTLTVSLIWEAGVTARPDFSTYVHLVNAAGSTVAQSDHMPGGDFYPPSHWVPGDVLRDEHRLTAPTDLAPGLFRLDAGAYVIGGSDSLSGVGRVVLEEVQLSR